MDSWIMRHSDNVIHNVSIVHGHQVMIVLRSLSDVGYIRSVFWEILSFLYLSHHLEPGFCIHTHTHKQN